MGTRALPRGGGRFRPALGLNMNSLFIVDLWIRKKLRRISAYVRIRGHDTNRYDTYPL